MGPVERQVAGNVACMRCGYPLRGLARDGDCPECGHAVGESVAAADIAGSSRSDASYSASTSYLASGIVVLVPISIAIVTLSLGLDAGIFLACSVPFTLFLHLCLLMASSLALGGDPLGEGRSVAERLIGGLGVALLISSLIAPVLLSALSAKPAIRSLDVLAPCVFLAWSALYVAVHGLCAVLFAKIAERCAIGKLAKPLVACARTSFVSAGGLAALLCLVAASSAIAASSAPSEEVMSVVMGAGAGCAALQIVSQCWSSMCVSLLRRHIRRARAARVSEGAARG